MLMSLVLNLCFWAGMGLLVAGFFEDVVSRLLAAVVVGFGTMVVSFQLLSLAGGFGLGSMTLICGLALVLGAAVFKSSRMSRTGRKSSTAENRADLREWTDVPKFAAVLVVGFALWAALDGLIYGLFTPVLVDSDAPIYHLPFAMHWAKAGRLDFVSTPFGEEGAPYFPANGDLWLTWLALTSRCALIIKVGQWPFLAIAGLALYGTARLTGASRRAAAIVGGIWCSMPLTLRQASVANVDLIWTAFYFIALYFILRFRQELPCTPHARRDLGLAALSLGIVVGTKSLALAFVPLLVGPLIWLIWIKGRTQAAISAAAAGGDASGGTALTRRTRWSFVLGGMGVLIVGIAVPSGFWFARNVWMTGNPLYPLDVSCFGFRLLAGWYDASAMRATAYHISLGDWPVLAKRLLYTVGPCLASLWFVCVISGAVWMIRSAGKRASPEACLLSCLALLQVAIYWFVVPYNTQERFLLPALGIGLVPLSTALTSRSGLIWPVSLLLISHLFLALRGSGMAMDDISYRTFRTLVQLGTGWRGAAIISSLAMAGMMAREGRWLGRLLALAAVVTGCSLYAAPLASWSAQDPERSFYPQTGFGARMLPAWRIVARASRPDGSRIAYSGGNLPYYLLGPNCRNDAIYVNINRHRNWLPHDYHEARRVAVSADTAAIPWPQWYRDQPDYEAWLDNLRAARIDLLFVSRINLQGRLVNLNGALPDFPVEATWADAHPEEFEFLGPKEAGDPISWARVYRLRERPADFGATPE